MKTIYFKTAIIFGLIANTISCNAQQLPLNTLLENIPPNAYVKDLNNELAPYIGTYKASYGGNEITLYITKVENKLEESTHKNFYMDALVVKYIVKNSSGTILQDTKNNNIPNIELYSTRTRPTLNTVILYYSGTNCHVGWGDIYLKKINNTQISWEYRPDDMVFTTGDCPQGTDKTIYLPETKDLIFTKQ
ncbi:DUF6705 family protein [Chryseobacterium sp. RU33C]|uniref:DUF6705 family protein n=1 Tax=Chryseobacterium sp. RU33C TaxID=1907398 RepID=UPI00095471C7|nr:DUF6705 family protein [Chryseobacterium sp. RU33C]SIR73071.1 hypothetical protein SAMN05880573_13914 [Chryseobacterium sp. RU33C]